MSFSSTLVGFLWSFVSIPVGRLACQPWLKLLHYPVRYSHTLSNLGDKETPVQFVTPLGALTQLQSYSYSLDLLFFRVSSSLLVNPLLLFNNSLY